MKWLIDALASLIFSILLACFVNVSKALIAPVEMDVTLIVKAIPILETFVNALKVLGLCIAVSITLISLKDSIQGPMAGKRAEPPLVLGFKLMFTLLLIMISVPIGEYVIKFAAIPYQSVQAISQSVFGNGANTNALDEFIKSFVGIMNSLVNPNRPNAVLIDSLTFGLYSLSDISSVVNNIIAICVLIPIGFQLISLCFDVFKRYVFMVMYIYFSPLAASTLASSKTAPIFRKYCEQVVSNILLTFLNVLMLVLILKSGPIIFDTKALSVWSKTTEVVPILQVALFWGLVRFAQNIDRNLGQLISVPSTGEGMGREMMSVRHAVNTGLRAVNTGRRAVRDLKGLGAAGAGGKIGKSEVGSGSTGKKYTNVKDVPKIINDKIAAVKNTGKNMRLGDVGQLLGNINNKAVDNWEVARGIDSLDNKNLTSNDKDKVFNALKESGRLDAFRTPIEGKTDAYGNQAYKTLTPTRAQDIELGKAIGRNLANDAIGEFSKVPGISSKSVDTTGRINFDLSGNPISAEMIGKDENNILVRGTGYFNPTSSKSHMSKNLSIDPYNSKIPTSVSAANRISLNDFNQKVTSMNQFDEAAFKTFVGNRGSGNSSFDNGDEIFINNSSTVKEIPNEGRIDVFSKKNEKIYEIYPASKEHHANAEIKGVKAFVKKFTKNP